MSLNGIIFYRLSSFIAKSGLPIELYESVKFSPGGCLHIMVTELSKIQHNRTFDEYFNTIEAKLH